MTGVVCGSDLGEQGEYCVGGGANLLKGVTLEYILISCIQQISSDPGDWSLHIRCQVTEIISTDQRSGSSRIIGVEILSARATLATILSKLQTLSRHSQIQLFISYCFAIVKIKLVTEMSRLDVGPK